MNGRDLFEVWAPAMQDGWTKFAKPALFVNVNGSFVSGRSLNTPHIPTDIARLNNKTTAIIVDLPGVSSVENGLGLAKLGFRPVPLYNGVHEEKIGSLKQIVDNTPIVDALKQGAVALRSITINNTAPPAFLLDYDRNKEIANDSGMHDNRWSIEFEDMPDANYVKNAGINRVVVWTKGEIRKDLLPILKSYQDMEIEVLTYADGNLTQLKSTSADPADTVPAVPTKTQEDIRKFENARFGLLVISGVAFINLFFMFFVQSAPLLWTSPSIMWLTYLWVPEIVGDALAVLLTGAYLALYLLSLKNRNLIMGALAFFGFDVAVFYVYVLYYGLEAWLYGLGVILLVLPIAFLYMLIAGSKAQKDLDHMDDEEYLLALDKLDDMHYDVNPTTRRRYFRGYRGYRGYGGSGRGGYRGSGYRGRSGGYGGFGG